MDSSWSTFKGEAEDNSSPRGPRCGMATMLEKLPSDAAREAVKKTLADKEISSSAIHKALLARLGKGTPSHFVIANHRRGGCRCEQ
jgi:hypothetical protein